MGYKAVDWEVEVYTLSARVWKTVSNIPSTIKSCDLKDGQVYVGGFIYFCALDDITLPAGRRSNLIVSFDLKSNEFGEVCLPDRLVHTYNLGVTKVYESLGLLEYYQYDNDDRLSCAMTCGVWVMKEGVSKTFTKMFSIKTPFNFFSHTVLELRKNGDAILQDNDDLVPVLEVSGPCSVQMNGVIRFGKKGKLAPRYVGPFEILERIGPVAYRLRLPEELSGVHDTFHVSNLKKCLADASLHVPLDEIKVDKTLRFVEEPVEIMDREVKSLKRSRILLVKVRWNSKRGPEFTWEREDYMKSKYHQLFVERADESAMSVIVSLLWIVNSERDRLIVVDRNMFVMFKRERLNSIRNNNDNDYPTIAAIIVLQVQTILPQIVTQVTNNVNNANNGNGGNGYETSEEEPVEQPRRHDLYGFVDHPQLQQGNPMNEFAPHRLPQPEGNMNGWLMENEEELERNEVDSDLVSTASSKPMWKKTTKDDPDRASRNCQYCSK
ncbi:hypothetical protein Tco_0462857 [Tanacetum coccineum]